MSWSINGPSFTIGDVTSTLMLCVGPDGNRVMQQESDYLTALRAARTWRVEGDTLTLAHPRGTSVVAVRMYQEMFRFRNFGQATTMAVILLVAVIPIMVINIRNLRRQGVGS